MSSSSDIEKLFDHFGGDANAYQEIGRENEARSARTRWPLLVTLDLTQPAIPAIGQPREPKPQAPLSATPTAVDRQDTTPRDVAAVTRAKAPLFARSHRRDIPPVVAAAPQPAAPSGASRFGVLEADDESTAQEKSAGAKVDAGQQAASAPLASVASVASTPFAHAAPVASNASASAATAVPPAPFAPPAVAPAALIAPASPVAATVASAPPAFLFRTPANAMPTPPATSPGTPAWAQAPAFAPAPAPAAAPAPAFAAAYAPAPAPATPATSTQPASILGKLFAAAAQPTPPQPASPANESAPLQSVFDRLRGVPAPTPATPAGASRAAAPGVTHSWLINGPRRS